MQVDKLALIDSRKVVGIKVALIDFAFLLQQQTLPCRLPRLKKLVRVYIDIL